MKTANLRIMGIDEGEEVQATVMHKVVKKIIIEKFPNVEKTMPIQVQVASRTPSRLTKIEVSPNILSLKHQAHSIEKEYWRL
jgi:hypothetical protein